MKTHHPWLVEHYPPKPTISYPNLQRSASPRLRSINWALDYPSRRCSASLRSLSFFSRHASCPTSPNPKLTSTHPSPTLTLLMPEMQQYNKQNKLDTMEGPLNRLKRNRSEWVWEIGVSHLMKDKPLRGRKLMLTLSPASRGRGYQWHHSMQASQLHSHSSNSMHRTSNSRMCWYLPLLTHLSSPTWNGQVSSQERWSISTMSFWGCTPYPTTTEKSSSSEEYSSSTEQLKQPRRSETWETGHKHFGLTQRQSPLFSPTEGKNSMIMQSRLPLSLWLSPRLTIPSLSTTIKTHVGDMQNLLTDKSEFEDLWL